MNNVRVVVTLKPGMMVMPWGSGAVRYTLRLVEADTLIGDALAGDGVTGQLLPDVNLTRQVWHREGRFWIEKGYISYHFHNKQFRLVTILHSDTHIWSTYISAPFTILAKRKERVHGYNSVSAKLKRVANNEVRRQVKAKTLASELGLTEDESREADLVFQSVNALKAPQQQYLMQRMASMM